MPSNEIELNPSELTAGAKSCLDAAYSARKGAERLGAATVPAGIFGDFDEAHQFHGLVEATHQHHQEQLQSHHAALTELAGKADTARHAFTGTDESEATAIDSAGTFE